MKNPIFDRLTYTNLQFYSDCDEILHINSSKQKKNCLKKLTHPAFKF